MRTFERKDNLYVVKFSGADFRQCVAIMHTLENAHFSSANKYWVCEVSEWNRGILTKSGFKDTSAKIVAAPTFIAPQETKKVTLDMSLLPKELFQYQIDGVKALEEHGGKFLLLDDLGVGKSIQSISYCALHPEFKKILVVCPGFIKTNWQREIKKWIKEPSTILSGKTPYSLEGITTRFIIINYDIISSWEKILLDYSFDLVIGDEAQYVANHTAQRTKAFVNIARSAPKRILLSGTLMRNRPSELFTSLNLISPTNFPNRWKFLWRYCDPKHSGYGWEFKGATNKEELAERMKYYYIRRMKKDVLKDLPQKQRNVIIFDMSDTKQKEYADASEKFQQWAENANKKFVDGKACIETLRQIAYLGKREYAIEWIQDFLESGKKLIVFVYHREAIKDVVGALGDKCVSIDGGDSQEDRQVSIDRFQNDPSVQVLVGQIQACGVGLTLTAASDVAFLEFPWSPADVVQAEDRVHRIGQTADKVSIWYLVSERTIDEEMALMIQEKYHVIDTIMDGGKSDPFFGQDIIAILLGKQHEKH